MQTEYSWPAEAECLEEHGLRPAKGVLDIGTGNGHFLCRMAERYPDKQFVGIETSEPLIERAFKTAREMNLPNIKFIHDECPALSIKEKFDFVLARLAIYCAPNRDDVLAWAYEILEGKSRMGVIELDYEVILVSDRTIGTDETSYQKTIRNTQLFFGDVQSSDDIIRDISKDQNKLRRER